MTETLAHEDTGDLLNLDVAHTAKNSESGKTAMKSDQQILTRSSPQVVSGDPSFLPGQIESDC